MGNDMMKKTDNEINVTWSSIEKNIPYAAVVWGAYDNGLPKYTFVDEHGKKIDINQYVINS